MTDTILLGISIAIFVLPCCFLVMAIRHFIPLVRGFNAPLWVYALGPIAFTSDRFFSEAARPHRKPFVGFVLAFLSVSFIMLAIASYARA